MTINDNVQVRPSSWGKDVAKALGYAKSRNSLAAHVDEEDKKDALIQGLLAQLCSIVRLVAPLVELRK